MHMKMDAVHIYYLKAGLRGPLLNTNMCRIHFHVHIRSTPPFLSPSLKGNGKSTQAYLYAAHIYM